MIEHDPVERPAHYRAYPGIEVIDLTKHMGFVTGNIVKYVARAPFKGNEVQDLLKAQAYLAIAIEMAQERQAQ